LLSLVVVEQSCARARSVARATLQGKVTRDDRIEEAGLVYMPKHQAKPTQPAQVKAQKGA
jgi:hypothetical protein